MTVEAGEVGAAEALLQHIYTAQLFPAAAASPAQLLQLFRLADFFQVGGAQGWGRVAGWMGGKGAAGCTHTRAGRCGGAGRGQDESEVQAPPTAHSRPCRRTPVPPCALCADMTGGDLRRGVRRGAG